ncbi:hypothetical protein D3C78_1023530 [compost metagenome]
MRLARPVSGSFSASWRRCSLAAASASVRSATRCSRIRSCSCRACRLWRWALRAALCAALFRRLSVLRRSARPKASSSRLRAEPICRAWTVRRLDGSTPKLRSASSISPAASNMPAATYSGAAGRRRRMQAMPQSSSRSRLPLPLSDRVCSISEIGSSRVARAAASCRAMSRPSRRCHSGAWRAVSRKLRASRVPLALLRARKNGSARLPQAPPCGHRYWAPRPEKPSMAAPRLRVNST